MSAHIPVLKHGVAQPPVALNRNRASREPRTSDVPLRLPSRPVLERASCSEFPYVFMVQRVTFLRLLRNLTLSGALGSPYCDAISPETKAP